MSESIKAEKVFVLTCPFCTPAETDSNLLKEYLRVNHRYCDTMSLADLIIVNTCAFIKNFENRSIEALRYVQRHKKKSAAVLVTGCLPAINKKRLAAVFRGPILRAGHLDDIDSILKADIKFSEIHNCGSKSHDKLNAAKAYCLRIGWGCNGKCTYCAIKNVFGGPRSRSMPAILNELNSALEKGHKNIILVANEVSVYGLDTGNTLIELLDKMTAISPDFTITLTNFPPYDFKLSLPKLKKHIVSKRISALYLAAQSGSDRVLKLMNRKGTVGDFKYCIETAKKLNPEIAIKTDLIVGFPQETERDFLDTLALIKWLAGYNVKADVLPFSARPNTAAGKMPGQLGKKIVNKRFNQAYTLAHFLSAKLVHSDITSRGLVLNLERYIYPKIA